MEHTRYSDTVTVLGGPGSGKGTMIKNLRKNGVNFHLFEVGAFCRDQVRQQTPLGQYIDALPKGKLVHYEVIKPHLQSAVKGLPRGITSVIDGMPRTPEQCIDYIEWMKEGSRHDLIVYLELHPELEEAKRLSDQRMSLRAGKEGESARNSDKDPNARKLRADEELTHLYNLLPMLQDEQPNRRFIKIDAMLPEVEVIAEVRRRIFPLLGIPETDVPETDIPETGVQQVALPPQFVSRKQWLKDGPTVQDPNAPKPWLRANVQTGPIAQTEQ